MGFTKTSEGRVFFQNADNDDLPKKSKLESSTGTTKTTQKKSAPTSSDPVMPRDNTQMQILMLLKSLNMKLKDSRGDQDGFEKKLKQYKDTITSLEEKAADQQSNYIDLEQKISRKQNEASKKAERVENSVKNTLDQLETAKDLVTLMEEKNSAYDTSLEALKKQIAEHRKKDELSLLAQKTIEKQSGNYENTLSSLKEQIAEQSKKDEALRLNQKAIEKRSSSYDSALLSLKEKVSEHDRKEETLLKNQKALEKRQKDQGEKMVNGVAAYVALTKRVSEAETRHEILDNKIEDSRSDFLKLDRKIDKAIEDRNRILRKIERIEQAVLETRDALNAKAMVLLTDQGVAGVDTPQITDETLQAAQTDDPMAQRRVQEEAMMPLWRRPVRVQSTSLALIMAVVLLLGWIINEARHPAPDAVVRQKAIAPPIVSLSSNKVKNIDDAWDSSLEESDFTASYDDSTYTDSYADRAYTKEGKIQDYSYEDREKPTDSKEDEHGITIHRGYNDPADIQNKATALDVNDDASLARAFEKDPESVAIALNNIEPGDLVPEDVKQEPIQVASRQSAPPEDFSQSESMAAPKISAPTAKTTVAPTQSAPAPVLTSTYERNNDYVRALKKRISPDSNLTEIARKIEVKAFDGVPEAQHDLGAIYVAGHGQIKQNLKRAIFWFTEASQNGIANATYNLGVLHQQGLGVSKSMKNAIKLYQQSAEMGHPEAQYNLGIAHIEGIGVAYSPTRSARYFEQAAEKGVTEAAYNLGLIYENGLLGDPQPDEALSWYKRAADQGSPEAESALEQLAASLGIGINDVSRIVDKVRAKKSQRSIAGGSASATSSSYLVSQIQEELMRRGLYPGPVDGMIGPMTRDAIKTFQAAANLDTNGTPSQELLGYLKATAR